jgi:hypothetical protein
MTGREQEVSLKYAKEFILPLRHSGIFFEKHVRHVIHLNN